MRVISGKYKKRRLYHGTSKETRPTQDRVKEAVFNRLGDLSNKAFLDLFAGTGSIGIEALSRGAAWVTFIEPQITDLTRNLDGIDCSNVTIYRKPFQSILRTKIVKSHIIYIDPPWNQPTLFDDALKHIFDFDILSPQGQLVIEYPSKTTFEWMTTLDNRISRYQYGNTSIGIYTHE